MKANKLIIALFIGTVLVLSSCSQTRYGHLTVAGKEGTRVQNPERTTKVEKERAVIAQQQEAEESPKLERSISLDPEVVTAMAEEASEGVLPELEERNGSTDQLREVIEVLRVQAPSVISDSKVVKEALERTDNTNSDKEVSGLVWIILVVLLILLIIELVGKIFPGLLQIILLLILVLFLLWLLGLI